jgi:hypothetical protein
MLVCIARTTPGINCTPQIIPLTSCFSNHQEKIVSSRAMIYEEHGTKERDAAGGGQQREGSREKAAVLAGRGTRAAEEWRGNVQLAF